MSALVVTGTDTGIGKTVVAAMLTLALDAVYWKPVQSGTAEGTDTATVAALTGLGPEQLRPRALRADASRCRRTAPRNWTASRSIRTRSTCRQRRADGRLLIVEGAGGVMVPLTRRTLYIDVFQRWGAPVVLCARTALGTINHSLLSIEALRRRDIPILGIVFVGDADARQRADDLRVTPASSASAGCRGCRS